MSTWRIPGGRYGIVAAGTGVALTAVLAVAAVALGPSRPPISSVAASASGQRQVFITSHDNASLAAVLRVPTHAPGTRVPAVLIIPAPWAADRDGREGPAGAKNSPYRVLAESLAAQGIASLRYDQRGTGETWLPQGDQPTGFAEVEGDAAAALDALRQQPDIDPGRIALLGHGAGGLAALVLAAIPPQPRVAVLVATPGRPLVQDLRSYIATKVLPGYPGREQALLKDFDRAASELISSAQAPPVDPALEPFFPKAHAALLRDLFRLDPAMLAHEVRIPVLIFNGRLDPQIPLQDAQLLASAFPGPRHETLVGAVTGHHLEVEADPASPDYHSMVMMRQNVPDTDRAAVDSIAGWIAGRLRS